MNARQGIQGQGIQGMEATPGIEPGYTDLQSGLLQWLDEDVLRSNGDNE